MRRLLALLMIAALIQAPEVAWGAEDDLFAIKLRPNVLILIDGSGSMDETDGGAYSVEYGVDTNGNGNVECSSGIKTECIADLDVDGIANSRNDVALQVVLDLLDANGDGNVNTEDEAVLGVRLGLMYYTSGGDNGDTVRPRAEIDYSFEVLAPLGTPFADIKKVLVDPIIAGVPDPNIVVGSLRGCSGTGSEDKFPCNSVSPPVGYALDDTPTAEALEYVEHYFFPEQLAADSEAECRSNFIILITDGASDGFTPTADVAKSIYNLGVKKAHGLGVSEGFKDRNGTLIPVPSSAEPWWNAKIFVVGFAGGDVNELNATALEGGTGTPFFETTVLGLQSALTTAFSQIEGELVSVAPPPLVVSTARLGSTNALYLGSFTSGDDPFWPGELTAYPLESDGTIKTDINGAITATPLWGAHTVLNGTAASARRIKTVLSLSGTTVVDFAAGDSALQTALNVTQDLNGDGSTNAADADWLIDYVRGTNGITPAWKLADIFHSTPVLVGAPSPFHTDVNLNGTVDTSFAIFRNNHKTRDRVLYVGSNGGMLHAFHTGTWTGSDYDTGTGAERWGFIPPNLLPKLQDMVNAHTFYVDGPPRAADVWIDGTSNKGKGASPADNVKTADEWHTVIVTGERRGGNAYFALDVTDPGTASTPNPPTFLWSFTDPNLGQTWSQPAIGKVKLSLDGGSTTIERWVAFVGGGYTEASAGSLFTYKFEDQAENKLTRAFTKKFARGVEEVNIRLASDVPGSAPPPSCTADCYAYDPNGRDPTKILPQDLGYVGNLDAGIYGSRTELTDLKLITEPVGKAFFVIDMNTGTKLWEYTVADDSSMDLIAAPPVTVDTRRDGFVDRVYVGDIDGNIWRFDLQAVGTSSGLGNLVSGWTGSKLFTAETGRPFYTKMAVAVAPDGQLSIYAGTGDVNDPMNQTTLDRFYAIKEAYPMATGTPPKSLNVPKTLDDLDLADVSGVNTLLVTDPVFTGTDGWYLTLPAAGEKDLADAEVFAGVVLFTSFTPVAVSCTNILGESQLYALSYLTGGGATDYALFTAGTEGLSRTHAKKKGVSTRPVISVGGRSGADVVMFVCTNSDQCGNPPPPQPGSLRWIEFWRDL